jgi:hypothetical protein
MVTMSLECATCGYASPEGFDRCPGCARPRRTRPATDPRTGGPMVDPDPDQGRARAPLGSEDLAWSPTEHGAAPHIASAGHAPYRSLLGPAQLARTLLAVTSWVAAALAAAIGAQMALRIDALSTSLPDGTGANLGAARAALGWAVLASTAAAVAGFVAWTARAHRNLPALGVREGRLAGAWAVVGSLLPGANLVVPKRVVDDLWRASSPRLAPFPGTGWQRRRVGELVHRWWALWLAVPAVMGLGSSAVARWAAQVEPGLALEAVDLAAAVLLVAAASAAHRLVAVITVAQARRAEVVAVELEREHDALVGMGRRSRDRRGRAR